MTTQTPPLTTTVQEMQLCHLCSAGFNKKNKVLAHDLGLHAFVSADGGESYGNDKYIYQQRKTRKENKI